MAIKRPTRSRATPVRKPAAASVHHIDVRPRHQMVAGETYEGWLCKSKACGVLIAIAPVPAGGKAVPEDHLTAIKCPHCGDEDLYRWSARSAQAYRPKESA